MLSSFIRPGVPPLSFKSNDELEFIIDNREKYLPESVEGAVDELQSRGKAFSDEELQVISEDMQARRQLAESASVSGGLFSNPGKNNFVDDPDAYVFYSRRVIRVFTILFSAFFGSIMMAINIGKTKNTTGVILVLLFGVVFTTMQIVILQSVHINSSLTIIFCLLAAFCLDSFFWARYLGKSTLYKPRTFWTPLIIGLAITGLYIWAILSGAGQQ
jgi:hypothetical protein